MATLSIGAYLWMRPCNNGCNSTDNIMWKWQFPSQPISHYLHQLRKNFNNLSLANGLCVHQNRHRANHPSKWKVYCFSLWYSLIDLTPCFTWRTWGCNNEASCLLLVEGDLHDTGELLGHRHALMGLIQIYLKGTVAWDGFFAHCILSRLERKNLKKIYVLPIFTELGQELKSSASL